VLVVRAHDHSALQRILGEDPYAQERLVSDVSVQTLDDLLETERDAERAPERIPGRPEGLGGHGHRLSAHEWRVARMMLEGLTNRQIAERFMVSPRAVEQHITRIYRKLSISRRAQLAVALENERASVG
jgi:DNA-binding NarL/FixJ family response regulator